MFNNFDPSEFTLVVNGATVIVPCISFTLYIQYEDSEGFLDFYRRTWDLLGSHFTHYITPSMKRSAGISSRTKSIVPCWIESEVREKNYVIGFNGCETSLGVTAASMTMEFSFRKTTDGNQNDRVRNNWRFLYAQGADLFWPGMSILRATIPLDHPIARDPSLLVKWVSEFSIVQHGNFLSGTCGLSVNYNEYVSLASVRVPMIQRLISIYRKYPMTELKISRKSEYRLLRWDDSSDNIVPQITRTSWLTLIGSGCLGRIGGINALAAAVSPNANLRLHTLDQGVIVQAGDAPILGTSSDKASLAAYRDVALLMRPLRMPVIVGSGGETELWIEEWQRSLEELDI